MEENRLTLSHCYQKVIQPLYHRAQKKSPTIRSLSSRHFSLTTMLAKFVHFERLSRLRDKAADVAGGRAVVDMARLYVVRYVAAIRAAIVAGQARPVPGVLAQHFALDNLVQLCTGYKMNKKLTTEISFSQQGQMLEGFTDGTTKVDISVGDSDPDVLGPQRSGSISQMVPYGSGSFPFLRYVLSRLK
jgi:hypothetical protein